MKKIIIVLLTFLAPFVVSAQKKSKAKSYDGKAEISCGQCQFKMKGKGCDLAVKIDDKTYWVDGATMADYGDAHAEDGFCNVKKTAHVKGTIKNDRFVASKIKIEGKP